MVTTETRVLAKLRKSNDLETHVRALNIDGVGAVELRDYIPSLDEYGRGYWVLADKTVLAALGQAIMQAAMEVGE